MRVEEEEEVVEGEDEEEEDEDEEDDDNPDEAKPAQCDADDDFFIFLILKRFFLSIFCPQYLPGFFTIFFLGYICQLLEMLELWFFINYF